MSNNLEKSQNESEPKVFLRIIATQFLMSATREGLYSAKIDAFCQRLADDILSLNHDRLNVLELEDDLEKVFGGESARVAFESFPEELNVGSVIYQKKIVEMTGSNTVVYEPNDPLNPIVWVYPNAKPGSKIAPGEKSPRTEYLIRCGNCMSVNRLVFNRDLWIDENGQILSDSRRLQHPVAMTHFKDYPVKNEAALYADPYVSFICLQNVTEHGIGNWIAKVNIPSAKDETITVFEMEIDDEAKSLTVTMCHKDINPFNYLASLCSQLPYLRPMYGDYSIHFKETENIANTIFVEGNLARFNA